MIDNKEILKNLGSNVKKLRTARKLTQEQLAEQLGLQVQTITSIEVGRSFISCNVLTNLCNFFNVEPSYFFTLNHVDLTKKDIDCLKEINRLLAGFSSEKLQEIYSILSAIKK